MRSPFIWMEFKARSPQSEQSQEWRFKLVLRASWSSIMRQLHLCINAYILGSCLVVLNGIRVTLKEMIQCNCDNSRLSRTVVYCMVISSLLGSSKLIVLDG